MKTIKIKEFGFAALFAGAVLVGFTSCETSSDNSKGLAEAQNEVTFDDNDAKNDADFLVVAAAILQKSAGLGELAESKATSQEVKDLGKTMAKAHTDDLAELRSLASSKEITLPEPPTDNTMNAFEDLNDKSGLEFDRIYCDKVVSSHKDAIDKIESIEKNAEDADIRAWAIKLLPHLRSHLTAAEAIHNSMKETKNP